MASVAADRKVPDWLHPAIERPNGCDIPSEALALHFARNPTPAMKARMSTTDRKETA